MAAGPERVGVLLPNVNALPVLVFGLWSPGKTPAMLNFSTGVSTMLACAQLAGLKHIVTSHAFLEKVRLKLEPLTQAGIELIFLEDVRAEISGVAKAGGLAASPGLPRRSFHGPTAGAADPAAVLFTSGSEGMPKGVELTHGNLLANIRQMLAMIDLTDNDRFLNRAAAVPQFRADGGHAAAPGARHLCVPLPLAPALPHRPAACSTTVAAPCSARTRSSTAMPPGAFLRFPFAALSFRGRRKGAGGNLAVWVQKFGVRILEGYGVTECSPAMSVNTPMYPRLGSAGRLMPGMDFRLEPVDGVADAGGLLLRGPNVMRGYLNPDANAKFQALGGWYDTGDIATVDERGYLFIRGR